ncbi:MAG: zinc-ribbon domain-containing protein [Oscillospiraceae bacterium]|nr:zinc-ribbon domain-containing protein [Oscillospiraceae bacterium]
MFCPECGKKIADSSKFCLECGAKIEGKITLNESTTNDSEIASPKISNIVFSVVGFLSIIGGILIDNIFKKSCPLSPTEQFMFGKSSQAYQAWKEINESTLLFLLPIIFGVCLIISGSIIKAAKLKFKKTTLFLATTIFAVIAIFLIIYANIPYMEYYRKF